MGLPLGRVPPNQVGNCFRGCFPVKKGWKRKVGESVEPSPATRQRIDSGGAVAMVPVFIAEVSIERLVVYPHPLFGPMVSFNKNALFPSKNSASLLGNPMYNLKLARSVVFVLDHQYVMKNNMTANLSKLIDLNLKVKVVVICLLSLNYFKADLLLYFQITAFLIGAADLHQYT